MKLGRKLFLSVGAILVCFAIFMYFLSYFLFKEDLDLVSQELKTIVSQEKLDIVRAQKLLVQKQLEEYEASISTVISLIKNSKEIQPLNSTEKKISLAALFEMMAKLLAFDPNINMIQVAEPLRDDTLGSNQEQHFYAIVNDDAPLYPFQAWPLTSDTSVIWLNNGMYPGMYPRMYLGISVGREYHSLLLFTPLQIWNYHAVKEHSTLSQKLTQARLALVDAFHIAAEEGFDSFEELLRTHLESKRSQMPSEKSDAPLPNSFEKLSPQTAVYRERIATFIQSLAPYFGQSLDFNLPTPIGIAELDLLGKPLALLSDQVFRTQKSFEIKEKKVTTQAGDNQIFFTQDTKDGHFYLASSLPLAQAELMIGMGIKSLIAHFALLADRLVILKIDHQIAAGATASGLELDKAQLTEFQNFTEKNAKDGMFYFLKLPYRVDTISLAPNWENFTVYLLTPKQKEQGLIGTLAGLKKAVSSRVTMHIVLILFGSLICALLILARISNRVTQPIDKLAKATLNVASGHYEDIDLPKPEGQKDEVSILTNSFKDMVNDLRDREKIRSVLNKVVSKEVAEEILKSTLHLGGEDRIITMLFSDIRGFTKLSENLAPQVVITMINTYMTKMSRIIETEGGCIDKYVGDEIMALYGAPVAHPDHALRAISSAILMVEKLRAWNKERSAEKRLPIEMGIGIHTGLVVVGNMGAEDRLNYTVLGSSVNLASRLCGVAKPMQILISESTLNEKNVKDSFHIEPLPAVSLKGFSEVINIYQINGFKWQ